MVVCDYCGMDSNETKMVYTDKYGRSICVSCAQNGCGMCGEPLIDAIESGIPINSTDSMGWCHEHCYDDLGDE